MQRFGEFVDRKEREAKKHLDLVAKLLAQGGMQVEDNLKDDDPYIFLHSPNRKLSVEGVRIYKIGSIMAYRVQKEEETHPFGKAYLLNLEEMFNDYMADNMKEEQAGKKVIEAVVEILNKFFDKTGRAEDDLRDTEGEDGQGQIILRTTGTDYSSLIFNKS